MSANEVGVPLLVIGISVLALLLRNLLFQLYWDNYYTSSMNLLYKAEIRTESEEGVKASVAQSFFWVPVVVIVACIGWIIVAVVT